MIFPGWRWFIEPSGGPYQKPSSWWTVLSEAPLPAHAIGVWLVIGYAWVAGAHGFLLWWFALGGAALWQGWQWEIGSYGEAWPREIAWRLLIGAMAALPAWVWL